MNPNYYQGYQIKNSKTFDPKHVKEINNDWSESYMFKEIFIKNGLIEDINEEYYDTKDKSKFKQNIKGVFSNKENIKTNKIDYFVRVSVDLRFKDFTYTFKYNGTSDGDSDCYIQFYIGQEKVIFDTEIIPILIILYDLSEEQINAIVQCFEDIKKYIKDEIIPNIEEE